MTWISNISQSFKSIIHIYIYPLNLNFLSFFHIFTTQPNLPKPLLINRVPKGPQPASRSNAKSAFKNWGMSNGCTGRPRRTVFPPPFVGDFRAPVARSARPLGGEIDRFEATHIETKIESYRNMVGSDLDLTYLKTNWGLYLVDLG
jgi:hypothetical protein